MIPCPSCQQPVEILNEHMGTLFTCPHCSSVYFIDWEGKPEATQNEPEMTTPPLEENFDGEISQESDFQASVSEAPYDFSQTLDTVPEPSQVSTADTADFSDVTDFANADTSVGPLTYTVIIAELESSQLLAQIKEAMTDSRFGWDVESVLSEVGGGRLILQGLSPAKASVLINRIKYLPLKITWRQDVLSGS